MRAWLAHLRAGDRPLSPRSLSQALSAIRTFHRFLDRRLDAPNAAIALVRGPRVKPGAPRPVTEDQAARPDRPSPASIPTARTGRRPATRRC